MEKQSKLISLVIPVHNCGTILPVLHEQILALFAEKASYSYEVIFIDDCSTDDTEKVIRQLKVKNPSVKFIGFTRNFGQVSAIEAGMKHAVGDAVIVVSADMQEPMQLAARMIEKWEAGAKIIIACRLDRSDSKIDRWFSGIFYRLIQWSNPKMPKGGFDYCLFDKSVNEQLNAIKYRNRFLQGDLLFLGHDITLVTYERTTSSSGSTPLKNFSFKVKYFIDGILNTTAFPIRIISILGVACTTIGFLYSLIIILNWVFGNTPFVGWAPIMIAIMIIGGLILLMLGVLGEYIWRIYDELKGMPKYIIKDKDLD